MAEEFEAGPGHEEAEEAFFSEAERLRKLAALEAVLFMAAEPLEARELADILEVPLVELEDLAHGLARTYERGGLQLSRIAGGYQVTTRPEYGHIVARLHKPERFRLSRAGLETLAIVAYKQPVTRPEIEAIRGVNSDSPLDTLVQYELVCEAGRKETPGRPTLYRTTDNFLGHFGLNSIEDLPGLESIVVEMGEEGRGKGEEAEGGEVGIRDSGFEIREGTAEEARGEEAKGEPEEGAEVESGSGE